MFIRQAVENERLREVESLRTAWIANNASRKELNNIINGIIYQSEHYTGKEAGKPAHIQHDDFVQTPNEQIREWQKLKAFSMKIQSGRF